MRQFLMNRYRVYSHQLRILLYIFILQIKCGYNILHGKSMSEVIQDREKLRKQIETKSLHELEKMFENMANQYKEFLSRIQDVNTVFVIENPYAGALDTSILELVQHVVNHGTYHRGNITAMIRQLGYSSTMMDFVLYLHMVQEGKELK